MKSWLGDKKSSSQPSSRWGAKCLYFVETGPEAVQVVIAYPAADVAEEAQEKIRS